VSEQSQPKPRHETLTAPLALPEESAPLAASIDELDLQTAPGTDPATRAVIPFEIKSEADYIHWGEQLKALVGYGKALEKTRKEITDPLEKVKKRVIALFAPAVNKVEVIRPRIERALLAYRERERAKQAAADAATQAALAAERKQTTEATAERLEAAGDAKAAERVREIAAATPPPAPIRQVAPAPKIQGASTKMVVKWAVDEPDKVPDRFWVIDVKAIQAEVDRYGMGTPKVVPGLMCWEEEEFTRVTGAA